MSKSYKFNAIKFVSLGFGGGFQHAWDWLFPIYPGLAQSLPLKAGLDA